MERDMIFTIWSRNRYNKQLFLPDPQPRDGYLPPSCDD